MLQIDDNSRDYWSLAEFALHHAEKLSSYFRIKLTIKGIHVEDSFVSSISTDIGNIISNHLRSMETISCDKTCSTLFIAEHVVFINVLRNNGSHNTSNPWISRPYEKGRLKAINQRSELSHFPVDWYVLIMFQ